MIMNSEIIMINIFGDDKPGVTASITEILGRYHALILDIGQADIHHSLSLGILFQVGSGVESGQILKEILFKCSELNFGGLFEPLLT
ncbi:MAG: phosphoserine phosphatase SerB, partial [Paludibacteraceae bacterium]|nr:phosphoserine phosphatase SerB [Paludibacteraceae bacterium]